MGGQMQDVVSIPYAGKVSPKVKQRRKSPSKSPMRKATNLRQVNAAAAKMQEMKVE